jgi:hypothetical protein
VNVHLSIFGEQCVFFEEGKMEKSKMAYFNVKRRNSIDLNMKNDGKGRHRGMAQVLGPEKRMCSEGEKEYVTKDLVPTMAAIVSRLSNVVDRKASRISPTAHS